VEAPIGVYRSENGLIGQVNNGRGVTVADAVKSGSFG
jgi:hypothetical protein